MKLQRQFTDGKCTHMAVIHTGASADQNFSQRLVAHGLAEGWLTRDGDHLLLKTEGEPLRYRIKREPGYYCRSTGERIDISVAAVAQLFAGHGLLSAAEANAWLVSRGKPAGDYEATWAYECELDAEQHARYRAVVNKAGNAVAAHTVEA